VFKECTVEGVGTRLARLYDSATTGCMKALVPCARGTLPAYNILKADVFETGIFHRYLVQQNRS
jgi:hypothetical protein